jgi:hypothetical protein
VAASSFMKVSLIPISASAPERAVVAARTAKPGIGIWQVVQHTRADDLIECSAKLPNLLDRKPMQIEILQIILPLEVTCVAQAGLADVDRRHARVRLSQCMPGGL